MSVWLKNTIIFIVFTAKMAAQAPDFGKPQTTLKFADSLADEGDYYRAITEYKKVLFFFPGYEKIAWVNFQIGKMYYLGGRFTQAKQYLVPLTESEDKRLSYLAHNYIALSYFENREFGNARRLFSDLASAKESENHKLDFQIYAMLAAASDKNFKDAADMHKVISKTDQTRYKEFFEKTGETLKKAAEIGEKSPGLAVFLGILFPGGGHLYLKHWDTALVTLSLVGGSAFLAYDGFMRESAVQAGLFLTFSTGIYIGSVYSAYRSTGKYNAELGDKEIRDMHSEFRRLNITISHKIDF